MTQDVAKVEELARLIEGANNHWEYEHTGNIRDLYTRLAAAILASPTLARMMEEARANERAAIVEYLEEWACTKRERMAIEGIKRGEHTETGS